MVNPRSPVLALAAVLPFASCVAVPLSKSAAPPEIEYTLVDSETTSVIVTESTREVVEPVCRQLGLPMLVVETLIADRSGDEAGLPNVTSDRRAMICPIRCLNEVQYMG